jgi:hypothetical protein
VVTRSSGHEHGFDDFNGLIDSVDRFNGRGANSPYADNAKHSAEEDASPAF